MVYLYYTRFKEELPTSVFTNYLKSLPIDLREKNSRYMRWQDRHANLFGKLLLIKGLKNYNCSGDSLKHLEYNEYTRPYLNGEVDFNISHSGKYVVCVIGKGVKLGVDIEEVKEIKLTDFRKVMTNDQWRDINQSENPTKSFFKYWTIKESVIKADSRGLSISLLNIDKHGDSALCDGTTWHLENINIDQNYSAFLATNKRIKHIEMIKVDFSKEIEYNAVLEIG